MVSENYLFAEYSPESKRRPLKGEITLREARQNDIDIIAELTTTRGQITLEEALKQTRAEFPIPPHKKIFVAEIDNQVVGFSRCIFLKEKNDLGEKRDIPEGWYLMGVLVNPKFRRMGIAEKLTNKRLEYILTKGSTAYYFSNSQNQSSIDLHTPYGFHEIARQPSFLNIEMDGGEGILFKAELT
jgi:ribosomal protein S18 acetylase RimI-like enzyme